jgi:predicted oxidoreductase
MIPRPHPDPKSLGPPHLTVGGLELWVHGRRFPEAHDYWDGNWLDVTVHCTAPGASIWSAGALLRVPDVVRWAEELGQLHAGIDGVATLRSDEPNLTAVVRSSDGAGDLQLVVDITPDHLTQEHRLRFAVARSAVPELVRQCRALVAAHPIRDPDGARDA